MYNCANKIRKCGNSKISQSNKYKITGTTHIRLSWQCPLWVSHTPETARTQPLSNPGCLGVNSGCSTLIDSPSNLQLLSLNTLLQRWYHECTIFLYSSEMITIKIEMSLQSSINHVEKLWTALVTADAKAHPSLCFPNWFSIDCRLWRWLNWT